MDRQPEKTAVEEKFQLHASALDTICWEEFRRKTIEREYRPKAVSLAVGTAAHVSIAANLTNKIETGALLEVKAVTEIARDSIVSEWEKGVTLDEEYQDAGGPEKAKAEAIDVATSLSALHHAELAPTIRPTHIERPWVLDIKGLPVQLAGTIDIQEPKRVRDEKTRRASPPSGTADKSLQLTAYSLAVKKSDGEAPAEVGLDFLVKTKIPKTVTQMSTRGPDDYKQMFARVQMIVKMLKAGLFPPVASDHWKCSNKYCSFHSDCVYARRPVTVGMEG